MASFRAAACAARAFSTSVRQAQLVKAPIQVFGQEGRYAHALYSAAAKTSSLEKTEQDLETVSELMRSNPELNTFLMNPSVQRKEKADLVKSVLENSNVSHLCKNLFVVMAENGALKKSNAIISSFNKIMRAQRGEVEVVVTTAKKLSADQMDNLNDALKGFLQPNQVIKLTTAVDASLIGGMTISIGDKFVDMSTANKMKTYTNLINQSL